MTRALPERESIVSQVISAIGPRKFNRCIDSLPNTKTVGRLRFWQETLLDSVLPKLDAIAHQYVSAFGQCEAFILLFEGEQRRQFSISKSEFLTNPTKFFEDPQCSIDDSWFPEALKNKEFRESLYDEIVVVLTFNDNCDESRAADVLRDHLPAELWNECYYHVRDKWRVPESEWRSEFLHTFPTASSVIHR